MFKPHRITISGVSTKKT